MNYPKIYVNGKPALSRSMKLQSVETYMKRSADEMRKNIRANNGVKNNPFVNADRNYLNLWTGIIIAVSLYVAATALGILPASGLIFWPVIILMGITGAIAEVVVKRKIKKLIDSYYETNYTVLDDRVFVEMYNQNVA